MKMLVQAGVAWPKISVVTPNRNGADTIRETINSIITQQYPNLEYIVIDGRSTDGSIDIIQEYAAHIDNFLYGKDLNLYDALAKAFQTATGDILCWLNSDDIFEPGILRRVGRIFAANPDWDVIYFDGSILRQGWRIQNRPQKLAGLPELIKGHILYQDDVFFTRRAYEAVGGLDRHRYRLAGDYDLWLRLAARFPLHYIPETASCFRLRTGQLSGDWGAYLAEMEIARAIAVRSLPPGFWHHTRREVVQRKRRTARIAAQRRFVYPLRDENVPWPELAAAPVRPLYECRCPVCGQPPRYLLFSSPDTWFGDRRIWNLYRCSACELSFVFPPPDDKDYHSLYRRAALCNPTEPVDAPPGSYSHFQSPGLLENSALYLRLSQFHEPLEGSLTEYPDVTEHKGAPILDLGCGDGEMLDILRNRGYENLTGMDVRHEACEATRARGHQVVQGEFLSTVWSGSPLRAIVLHQTLQYVHDPVNLLRHISGWLQRGGRIYISTPNLDSIWLERYGPVWSHWHPPFHRFILSPKALRRLAAAAGCHVIWMKTATPAHWLYMSDQLAMRGLGGYVPPGIQHTDGLRWAHAQGAAVATRIRWDWRLRGECLHACLIPRR